MAEFFNLWELYLSVKSNEQSIPQRHLKMHRITTLQNWVVVGGGGAAIQVWEVLRLKERALWWCDLKLTVHQRQLLLHTC